MFMSSRSATGVTDINISISEAIQFYIFIALVFPFVQKTHRKVRIRIFFKTHCHETKHGIPNDELALRITLVCSAQFRGHTVCGAQRCVWWTVRSLCIFFKFKGELPGRGHDSDVGHPNSGMGKIWPAVIFGYY
jgi:hypothetical protein